jgi:hypothetical protein
MELGGTEHATEILAAHSDLPERIAVWFRERLGGGSRECPGSRNRRLERD